MLKQLGDKSQLIIYPFIRLPSEIRPGSPRMTADPETGDVTFMHMVVNGDRRVDMFLQAVAVCRDYIEEVRRG